MAQEFAKALKINGQRKDGYLESEDSIVTWCVGHLVTMSYPEKYDEKYKRWSFDTLPFLPREFKYEVIPGVQKQFQIVKGLLNRPDVETIYVCTDSGREGEYIYRLVAQMAGVKNKKQKRVWIDSQTEEEILRGIREAKDLSAYDNLADSAYLRAKEDYLMGINFSRVLTLRYGNSVSNYLRSKYQAISVGRVMTCVLGMVVRREREIRSFVKTPFYRVIGRLSLEGENFEGEWRAAEGSRYFQSPRLYKENGFKEKKDAEELIQFLEEEKPLTCRVEKAERKKEKKNPPLLFNLAELQNVCSKLFKISPDETLRVVQELYEKKLVTYPGQTPVSSLPLWRRKSTKYFRTETVSRDSRGRGRDPYSGYIQKYNQNTLCKRQTDHGPLRHHSHGTGTEQPECPASDFPESVRGYCAEIPVYFLSSGCVPESKPCHIHQRRIFFLVL